MFNSGGSQPLHASAAKDLFLKQAEEARTQRQRDKKKAQSALLIQAHFRGYLTRQREHEKLLQSLIDALIGSESTPPSSEQLYSHVRTYLFLIRYARQVERIEELLLARLCARVAASIQSGDFKHSYVALIISKSLYKLFLAQSSRLVAACLGQMQKNALSLKNKDHYAKFNVCLELVNTLCHSNKWKCFKAAPNKLVEAVLAEATKTYLNKLQTAGWLSFVQFFIINR